ncbi:hypothetical protein LA080_007313 [Diaporthe eres]|nr:hypothetical protein LA080_007313 [Diaporthe eres]
MRKENEMNYLRREENAWIVMLIWTNAGLPLHVSLPKSRVTEPSKSILAIDAKDFPGLGITAACKDDMNGRYKPLAFPTDPYAPEHPVAPDVTQCRTL